MSNTLRRLPKLAYIPDGLTVDYAETYRNYVEALIEWEPSDNDDYRYLLFSYERMVRKSFDKMMALQRPDAAYALYRVLCEYLPLFIQRPDLQAYHMQRKPRLRKMVKLAFTQLMQSTILWNNEEARLSANAQLVRDAASFTSIGLKPEKLQALQTTVPLSGPSKQIKRTMNREEREAVKWQAYQAELAAKKQTEEEAEKYSLIPLNPEMEALFDVHNIDWECAHIGKAMLSFRDTLNKKLHANQSKEALLLFLQMMKSLCRHFVRDEHYAHFDDMYAPEYAAGVLLNTIQQHSTSLSPDDLAFFHEAWNEIKCTEAVQNYGVLGILKMQCLLCRN